MSDKIIGDGTTVADIVAERDTLRAEVAAWSKEALAWRNGCTGRHGSQMACVNVAALADKPKFTDGRGNSLDHLVDEKP